MLSRRASRVLFCFGLSLACSGCLLDGGPVSADTSSSNGGSGGNGVTSTSSTGTGGTGNTGGTDPTGGSGGGTTTTSFTDPPDCSSAAECDDGNPCTVDACPSGECTHENAADGVTPPGVTDLDLQDCKRPACHGGVLGDDADPSQTPAPAPDGCSMPVCNGTEPSSFPTNEGFQCGEQPIEQCKESVCSNGSCNVQDKPNGLLYQGNQFQCSDVFCSGGFIQLQPNTGNCVDNNPENCTVPSCNEFGTCMGVNAPQGQPCKKIDGTGGTCNPAGVCS